MIEPSSILYIHNIMEAADKKEFRHESTTTLNGHVYTAVTRVSIQSTYSKSLYGAHIGPEKGGGCQGTRKGIIDGTCICKPTTGHRE